MSNAIEQAKSLLDKIEAYTPLKVNEATLPTDVTVIATIRGDSGYPVLAPHPESVSMLTGPREVFEFFVFAPKVLRDLVEYAESYERSVQSNEESAKVTPVEEVSTPDVGPVRSRGRAQS